MAALAGLAWPSSADYFAQWLLAGCLTAGSVAASAKGTTSLRQRYRRRVAKAAAASRSSSLGDAKFAGLSERSLAGLHDLSAPLLIGLTDGVPTLVPKSRHLAVEAPTGGSKTSGIVVGSIWNACANGFSVAVQDAKPELCFLLGDALTKAGYKVIYNNPAGVADFPHTDSNPFAGVVDVVHDAELCADAITIADALALSLIPEAKADNKNKFFIDLERECLSFTIVALAALFPARCFPAGVLRSILDPGEFRDLCLMARESDLLEGDLAALSSSFLALEIENPEHLSSARSGAKNALSIFKASSRLGKVGANHEFDPTELRTSDRPVVVFDLARPDILDSFAKVNALTQTARLQALRRCRGPRPVLLLCDEATTLPVPSVVRDLELMRSFNVTIGLFFQSYSSLVRVYGEHNAKSIMASSVQVFMTVNTVERARELSERLGNRTVKTSSFNFSENGAPSSGVGEQARPLLSPDEILALPPGTMLMNVPGLRPIKLEKAPYFEVEPLKSMVGTNPHEDHPPSKKTVLTLNYANDPLSPSPPILPDRKERYACARAIERARNVQPRAKRFLLREFLWVPAALIIAASIFLGGTPHLLLESSVSDRTVYRCAYFGPSGFKQIEQAQRCEIVEFIRFQNEERTS